MHFFKVQGLIILASHLQTEMMSEAIDDALDDDEAEEETDDLTNQVHTPNGYLQEDY